ncbi:hypothetical protein U1Q18_028680 [Sarracenia purpurea var. burkii]
MVLKNLQIDSILWDGSDEKPKIANHYYLKAKSKSQFRRYRSSNNPRLFDVIFEWREEEAATTEAVVLNGEEELDRRRPRSVRKNRSGSTNQIASVERHDNFTGCDLSG